MVARLFEYAEDSQGTGRRLVDEMDFECCMHTSDHVFRRSMKVVLDKFAVLSVKVKCHRSIVRHLNRVALVN